MVILESGHWFDAITALTRLNMNPFVQKQTNCACVGAYKNQSPSTSYLVYRERKYVQSEHCMQSISVAG
jgi:hypothetical protein